MAERKKKAAGKGKAKRKAPAKRSSNKRPRKKKAEQRQEEGQAVQEDLRDGEVVPWGHLDAGKKLSALDQMKRDSEIFRSSLRGLSPETLAETFQLSPRRIREIVKEWRAQGVALSDLDQGELIEEHVSQVNEVISELAAHASREKGPGRTAAIRARLEAMRERFKVLQEVGLLPQDLGTIGVQIDIRAMGMLVIRALEKRGYDEPELMEELADIAEGKQHPDEIKQLPAAA